MSHRKLVLVGVLSLALTFFAALIPSIAGGLHDEDSMSTTELVLAPPLDPSTSTVNPQGTPAQAATSRSHNTDVDPDCYDAGLICKKERLGDAEELATMLAPLLTPQGWPSGCFEVRFIAGDAGGPDAISVTVSGKPGLGPTRCRDQDAGAPSKTKLEKLADALQRAVDSSRVSRNVDIVQLTDGIDADIQRKVR